MQVISQLVYNAKEHAFNERGDLTGKLQDESYKGKKIRLSSSADEENKMIYVSVSDNGVGIKPEHLDKIFGDFSTRKHESDIHGNGLKTAKKIVEDSGGTISVESQKGDGALFTFTIPYSEKQSFLYVQ